MTDRPGDKYSVPEHAINIEVPLSVANRHVTVHELVRSMQVMQKFVIASSALTLAAAKGHAIDENVEGLYKSFGEVRALILELLEQKDG